MKFANLLGLAVVAAVALIAFVGSSSASADVVCTKKETPCLTENVIVVIRGRNVGVTKLTTSFKTIECSKSSVEGKVTTSGLNEGEAIEGPITSLSFEECNCEIKVLSTGSLKTTKIGETSNGTVSSSGAEVTASCSTIFGTVHCIYATLNTDLGVLTGGEHAKLDVSEANIPRLTTSALCAEKAKWDAEYEIFNHDAVYIEPKTI